MATADIHQLNVTVNFDPKEGTVTFGGDVEAGNRIPVPQGITFIVLELVNLAEPIVELNAVFPTNPIQWVKDGKPIVQPPIFQAQRLSDRNTTIQVINTVLEEETHDFFVIVQVGTRFFGADPTIVNQPPGGGL